MSRTQKLILAAMAVADFVVLGLMAAAVIASTLSMRAQMAAAVPTPGPTLMASNTPLPTWTPTYTPEPLSSPTRKPTSTPTNTPTPWPTFTPSPVPTQAPTPLPAILLQNPTFDDVRENEIPGWQTGAFINWSPGDESDPGTSFAAPRFHQADDSRQWITGDTLQIDTADWVKLKAWVYQTVEVPAGSQVQFEISAFGFVRDTAGGYFLKVGIDPDGGVGCDAARWGEQRQVNQNDGVVQLTSPQAVAGGAGRVTVCAFAETQYAQAYHAAFFDDAVLILEPPDLAQ